MRRLVPCLKFSFIFMLACSPQAAKKMTTVRAFQASADLSEEELLDAVAMSSKSAAVGVVKVRQYVQASCVVTRPWGALVTDPEACFSARSGSSSAVVTERRTC